METGSSEQILQRNSQIMATRYFCLTIKENQTKRLLQKIKFQKVDITSLKSLKKIKIPTNSILLHCAGQPSAAVSFSKTLR